MPMPRNRITLVCEKCGKTFERKVSARKPHDYCSIRCYASRHEHPVLLNDDGLTARIPLVGRGGEIKAYALIDAADGEWASQWQWGLSVNGHYAVRTGGVRLHRELLGLKSGDGLFGDHINRDTLDNRRCNLRVATPSESPQNIKGRSRSSAHRGVAWSEKERRWVAYVHLKGKKVYWELFGDESEAAEAARLARARFLPFAVD